MAPPDAQPLVPQQYDPQGFQPPPQAGSTGKTGFTSAERFWYLLGNIALGAMYLRKVPAKKAMSEFGLVEMTSGEKTWYTILCILCGAGYFAKLPVAKAISETPPYVTSGQGLTAPGGSGTSSAASPTAPTTSRRSAPRRRCPTSAWPR